jgi:hypothetical protein
MWAKVEATLNCVQLFPRFHPNRGLISPHSMYWSIMMDRWSSASSILFGTLPSQPSCSAFQEDWPPTSPLCSAIPMSTIALVWLISFSQSCHLSGSYKQHPLCKNGKPCSRQSLKIPYRSANFFHLLWAVSIDSSARPRKSHRIFLISIRSHY